MRCSLIAFITLFLSACNNPAEKSPVEDSGSSQDTGGPVDIIPSPEDTGVSVNCDLTGIDPYDWGRVFTYELSVTPEAIAALEAMGYTSAEVYGQLPPVTGEVEVTPDGCDTTKFSDVQLEIGREMGYIVPPGETSWRVDFDEVHGAQEIGLYDNARWWSPLFSGPVAEMFLYRFSTNYLGIPGRRMAWMKLSTSYWPEDVTLVYNAFEPYSEDMLNRDYGPDGWVSMYEGDPAWNTCQVGLCDTSRLNECLEKLWNISDPDALLPETTMCFKWENVAAVYAWEVYFSHGDGCMAPHNCMVQETGSPLFPEATTFSLRIAGVDLVNPNWTSVEGVNFQTYNSLFFPCWQDQSEGGCRDMFIADVRTLIAVGREGLMNADLDTVAAQRKLLGLWWEGEDDGWYADQANWLAERPDYVEDALEEALDPCQDWAVGWWGGWDTGSAEIPGCGNDTAPPPDTGGQ